MNKPAAFRATYSDLKLIKTRQCVQIVFELPLADFDAAYDVLGGLPDNSKETWFAIAPLTIPPAAKESKPDIESVKPLPDTAGAKRDWRDMQPSAQAGIRCSEAAFWVFLWEEYKQHATNKDDAATAVRFITKVNSRAHFNTNHAARVLWHQLDSQYMGWLAKERVGA